MVMESGTGRIGGQSIRTISKFFFKSAIRISNADELISSDILSIECPAVMILKLSSPGILSSLSTSSPPARISVDPLRTSCHVTLPKRTSVDPGSLFKPKRLYSVGRRKFIPNSTVFFPSCAMEIATFAMTVDFPSCCSELVNMMTFLSPFFITCNRLVRRILKLCASHDLGS